MHEGSLVYMKLKQKALATLSKIKAKVSNHAPVGEDITGIVQTAPLVTNQFPLGIATEAVALSATCAALVAAAATAEGITRTVDSNRLFGQTPVQRIRRNVSDSDSSDNEQTQSRRSSFS